MKLVSCAFAFAALFASPASAIVLPFSEHNYSVIAHVEVVGGHHEKTGKRK